MIVRKLGDSSVAVIEGELRSTRRGWRIHLSRCKAADPAACERCQGYERREVNALARLDAVTSQQPDRHISIDGAERRRGEMGEARRAA